MPVGAVTPSFAELATASCPPYGPMLLAVEAELAPVDGLAVDARLDALALPLFGRSERSPAEQAEALEAALRGALAPSHSGPEALLVGAALRRGAAHPLLRAAIGAELARRAGIPARVAATRGRWLLGLESGGPATAVDCGADPEAVGDAHLCGHEVAFAVLTRLAGALERDGRLAPARRAAGLRLLLPLDPEARTRIRRELSLYDWRR